MALINSPPLTAISGIGKDGKLTPPAEGWRGFFNAVFNICNAVTLSGTTAQRPTVFLWEGRPYTDTTVGLPIWYIGGIWVDATGTPV